MEVSQHVVAPRNQDLNSSPPNPDVTPRETGLKWWRQLRQHFWILVVGLVYFLTLSATLIYKHHCLLNDWPFDEAYMIQQFHNWKSGYPKVTIQPGDLRSGFPGEKPFEENHKKHIYTLFKAFYWIWPYPETLILLYAFLVSLSVITLYIFLNQLSLGPVKVFALVGCWMLYPLQQKVAAYSYCDPLSMSGTFYFFYLYLLCRNSPFAILGCLGLLLPREQTPLLILPTMLLLPQKWKTLLWHFACVIPFLVLARPTSGNPFAYAADFFHTSFISNFLLTQTVLWVLALVNPWALLLAVAFVLAMIGVGGEVYFRFPYEYLGPVFLPDGSYYYYGLFMAPMMAAVALGIAKLKPNQTWRLYLSLALLLVPGIAYGLCQFRFLSPPRPEIQQIKDFQITYAPTNTVVVTDYSLSAVFANRDQIYVYLQPPKGVSPVQIFSFADVAVIPNTHAKKVGSLLMQPSGQNWQPIMKSENYTFFKRTVDK